MGRNEHTTEAGVLARGGRLGWRTCLQSTDLVLPVRDGRNVRLRCIVRPDRAQSILLDHLGLILPERLKSQ